MSSTLARGYAVTRAANAGPPRREKQVTNAPSACPLNIRRTALRPERSRTRGVFLTVRDHIGLEPVGLQEGLALTPATSAAGADCRSNP